jgi:hypothetical protein
VLGDSLRAIEALFNQGSAGSGESGGSAGGGGGGGGGGVQELQQQRALFSAVARAQAELAALVHVVTAVVAEGGRFAARKRHLALADFSLRAMADDASGGQQQQQQQGQGGQDGCSTLQSETDPTMLEAALCAAVFGLLPVRTLHIQLLQARQRLVAGLASSSSSSSSSAGPLSTFSSAVVLAARAVPPLSPFLDAALLGFAGSFAEHYLFVPKSYPRDRHYPRDVDGGFGDEKESFFSRLSRCVGFGENRNRNSVVPSAFRVSLFSSVRPRPP